MKQSSSKNAFIETIDYAQWFLMISIIVFIGISFVERPSWVVLFLAYLSVFIQHLYYRFCGVEIMIGWVVS
jgi:hypothetical protein